MSQPRLHDDLQTLFQKRSDSQLQLCLHHPDHQAFLNQHGLKLEQNNFSIAFTHSSFAHEYQVPHQEQLEFLGDAVLQLILTHELYSRFGEESEGKLSKLRSTLVNEKTLAALARALNLSGLILVGKGEFRKKTFEQDAVLADTLEAVLGEIYRTQGLGLARTLFLSWLEQHVPEVWSGSLLENFDPKSLLQERSLARFKALPVYTSEAAGESFRIQLFLNGELAAAGVFPSKRLGEKQLAQEVLQKGMI